MFVRVVQSIALFVSVLLISSCKEESGTLEQYSESQFKSNSTHFTEHVNEMLSDPTILEDLELLSATYNEFRLIFIDILSQNEQVIPDDIQHYYKTGLQYYIESFRSFNPDSPFAKELELYLSQGITFNGSQSRSLAISARHRVIDVGPPGCTYDCVEVNIPHSHCDGEIVWGNEGCPDPCPGKVEYPANSGNCLSRSEAEFKRQQGEIDGYAINAEGHIVAVVESTSDNPSIETIEEALATQLEYQREKSDEKTQRDERNTVVSGDNTSGVGCYTQAPVDFINGCKTWSNYDIKDTTGTGLKLLRQYKTVYEHDFSLGKFQSFTLDSRIILGQTDVTSLKESAQNILDYAEENQNIITQVSEETSNIETNFAPNYPQNTFFVQYIDSITGNTEAHTNSSWKKKFTFPAVDNINALIGEDGQSGVYGKYMTVINSAASQEYKNRYSIVGAQSETALVGNDRLRWVSPNGGVYSFILDGTHYIPEGHLNGVLGKSPQNIA